MPTFTPQTANGALALVRPIVSDIVETMGQAQAKHEHTKKLYAAEKKETPEITEQCRITEALLQKVQHFSKELEDVGVVLKDITAGLVDFPALYQGRPVYLCWMLGEETVASWHEMKEGFSQRRHITEDFTHPVVNV